MLDLLPIELLYTLFTYFLAHEILLTFSGISDYIDAILLSYSAYRLDLKSINKFDFDLVRQYILPKQVIYLSLADDNDTFVQSDLFFSYFQIEQFTQLRSLRLINIQFESLRFIFSNLHVLTDLRSLSFDVETIRHRFPSWNDDYTNESNRLKSFLFQSYTQVLPRLNRICLNSSADLISIPLPYLRYLKLEKVSFDELKRVFLNAPQLHSLNISLDENMLNSACVFPSNQLIRFNLKLEHRCISKDQIKEFLSNLPHLKYLELKAIVSKDIADGDFWQILTSSFRTFNFQLNTLEIDVQITLDSFRTSYWLEEKRWYVAFQNNYLFSIPYFASVHIDSIDQLSFYSTAPDDTIIYQHLNKFTMNTIPRKCNYRFSHIKVLELKFAISFELLNSFIDLNQIKHLVLSSLDHLLIFTPIRFRLTQLVQLTMTKNVTIDMIKPLRNFQFEQIRQIEIYVAEEYINCINEELFHLFPSLEHLMYKSCIQSVEMMIYLINGFKYLSNACFFADCSFFWNESEFCRNQNSTSNNTICRVYHVIKTDIPFSIYWRIEKQPSIRLSIINWHGNEDIIGIE